MTRMIRTRPVRRVAPLLPSAPSITSTNRANLRAAFGPGFQAGVTDRYAQLASTWR